jgi:hypothetical protein
MNKLGKRALLLLLAPIVVLADLYCFSYVIFGFGGLELGRRNNWFEFVSLFFVAPLLVASVLTFFGWLSVRLWRAPKWRFISFPIVIGVYAIAASLAWTVTPH